MIFKREEFTAHSGRTLPWKLDADGLEQGDLRTLAWIAVQHLPKFGTVEGVPRGGLSLAALLRAYTTQGAGLLIVDDVMTTGGSLEEHRDGRKAMGLVIFNRSGVKLSWVHSMFTFSLPQGFE